MPPYESDGFDPPAPLTRAAVVGGEQRIVDVRMLVDTGADVSTIPRAVAKELGTAVRSWYPSADIRRERERS